MVFPLILRRSCLSTYIQPGQIGSSTSTTRNSSSHSLYNCFVMLFTHFGIAFSRIQRIERFIFNFLHHMRCNEITTISNCSPQIGYLQWCCSNFTLPYRNRDNSQTIPRPIIVLVIILVIRNHPSFLPWQIYPQWISKSHRDHVITPCSHCILNGTIFLSSTNHVIQSPTKISITRCCNGRNQWNWSRMSMASYSKT